jgi:hypothetical protein
MWLLILIPYIVLAFILASIADSKGRSYGGYLAMGICFSPVIGFIILIAEGENKEVLAERGFLMRRTKICPFCANSIKQEAVFCEYCRKEIPIKDNETMPIIEPDRDVPVNTNSVAYKVKH